MREPNGRRDMLVELRLLGMAAALAVSGLVVMACGSPAGEIAGPTSNSTSTPTAVAEQASAEPTHTPTPTPTPAASGQRDSGSDSKPAATPTPTPTPASDPEPSATTTVAVTTTEEVVAEPPLRDCFGGALSEDPLHCYVLEQAQAAGLMDILGVYDGDAMLYVSVSQPRVTNELFDFALEQSYAFYDAWPRLVPRSKYLKWVGCTEPSQPWPDCYLDSVGIIGLRYQGGYILLPQTSAYDAAVLVVTGGDSGRRQTSGWASWRQLWRKPESTEGGRRVSVLKWQEGAPVNLG